MDDLILREISNILVGAILFLPPFWFIFKKTGLSPYLSILVLLPPMGLGLLVTLLILGFKKWPNAGVKR